MTGPLHRAEDRQRPADEPTVKFSHGKTGRSRATKFEPRCANIRATTTSLSRCLVASIPWPTQPEEFAEAAVHINALFADKAAVTACENHTVNYDKVGIKITQPTGTAVIVENRFENKRDGEGVNVTGSQAVVENNRVEKPKPTDIQGADTNKLPSEM